MIKAGIIGATGYAGAELVRILLAHPEAEIVWYGSRSYVDQPFAKQYGNFIRLVDDVCRDDNLEELSKEADVIFTATPQGLCASLVSDEILNRVKIIDLSADFRLKDVSVYEEWYKIPHAAPQYLDEAVYGLCEINREAIKKTRLVANPGCYTTCSILSLYPLVREGLIDPDTMIIDAKSGTSGAGRGAKVPNLFCEVNENIKAYGVTNHRHTPEIEEQLGYAAGHPLTLNFTPHLVPMNRGILVTAYASLSESAYGTQAGSAASANQREPMSAEVLRVLNDTVREIYQTYYGKEPFIRLLDGDVTAETRWVEGSNYVDIGFRIDPRTHRIIVMGALDNLVKGAAGQAVQNMNLMFGLPETCGLQMVPVFP